MTDINSAIELANTLKTLLAAELGQITSQSGLNLGGVWIVPPTMPGNYKPSGMIAFVQRFPESVGDSQPLTGYMRYIAQDYLVRLVQYSEANADSVKLTRAIERIVQRFGVVRSPMYMPPTTDAYEQATVRIKAYTVLRTI